MCQYNAVCKVNIDVPVSIPLQGSWKILIAYFYLQTEKSEQQCNYINLLLLSIHDMGLKGWGLPYMGDIGMCCGMR